MKSRHGIDRKFVARGYECRVFSESIISQHGAGWLSHYRRVKDTVLGKTVPVWTSGANTRREAFNKLRVILVRELSPEFSRVDGLLRGGTYYDASTNLTIDVLDKALRKAGFT